MTADAPATPQGAPTADRRCTARSHTTGERCGGWAVNGTTKCHHHGGRSLQGADCPSARHFRLSKVLPRELVAAYAESLTDPSALELRPEIAVVDARIEQLVAGLSRGESVDLHQSMGLLAAKVHRAVRGDDDAAVRDAAGQLADAVLFAAKETASWKEIVDTVLVRRRLVDTERKRLVQANEVMTRQQTMALIGYVAASLRRNVTNPDDLRAVMTDIADLMATRRDQVETAVAALEVAEVVGELVVEAVATTGRPA